VDRGLTAAVDATEGSREKLLAVYDYLAGWFAEDTFRGCGFINAFGELGSTSPEVAGYARAPGGRDSHRGIRASKQRLTFRTMRASR
jgi:hypothetical protein